MKKYIYVTTSWDDGHKLDIRVSKLLKKYGLKGTFYVSPKNRQFGKSELLSEKELKNLSKDFEIGAHTITHPLLPNDIGTTMYKLVTKLYKFIRGKKYRLFRNITTAEAKKEIEDSKHYLEKLLGRKIETFCYPAGQHNRLIQKLVKTSGYKYARTVEMYSTKLGSNLFASPTTIHTASKYGDIIKLAKLAGWDFTKIKEFFDWENLAKHFFDNLNPGDVYHIWGHSWIIDGNDDWKKLEKVLSYISNKPNIKYIENKDLVNIQNSKRRK